MKNSRLEYSIKLIAIYGSVILFWILIGLLINWAIYDSPI